MKDLIIVGAGGFGRELLQWCKEINAVEPKWNIKGFIDDNQAALDGYECDCGVIGTISDWAPDENEEYELTMDSSYANGDWDSLMHLRLMVEICDEFDVDIPSEKLGSIKTLRDFYGYIDG